MTTESTDFDVLYIRIIVDGDVSTAGQVLETLKNYIRKTLVDTTIDVSDAKPYWKIKNTCEVNVRAKSKNLFDQADNLRNSLGGGTWKIHQHLDSYYAIWNKENELLMEMKSPRWAHIEVCVP